jgi:hypothetical protein
MFIAESTTSTRKTARELKRAESAQSKNEHEDRGDGARARAVSTHATAVENRARSEARQRRQPVTTEQPSENHSNPAPTRQNNGEQLPNAPNPGKRGGKNRNSRGHDGH